MSVSCRRQVAMTARQQDLCLSLLTEVFAGVEEAHRLPGEKGEERGLEWDGHVCLTQGSFPAPRSESG